MNFRKLKLQASTNESSIISFTPTWFVFRISPKPSPVVFSSSFAGTVVHAIVGVWRFTKDLLKIKAVSEHQLLLVSCCWCSPATFFKQYEAIQGETPTTALASTNYTATP
jgi:hypothetical protein